MLRISADTNLFVYAADPDSPMHSKARDFFRANQHDNAESEFVVCELVLIELYMQLRNPAVFKMPYSATEAASYCQALKKNPTWRCVDYEQGVSVALWRWASDSTAGFRQVIDARLGLTLRHHGVTDFATANVRDFQQFGFTKVWNPIRD
jgi:uncharacterized protein